MHARQWPDGEAVWPGGGGGGIRDGGTLLIGDDGISVRSTDNAVETWSGRQAKTL